MSVPLLFELKAGVAYVTPDRPEAGDAIDLPLARHLLNAVMSAEAEAHGHAPLRVYAPPILTGSCSYRSPPTSSAKCRRSS